MVSKKTGSPPSSTARLFFLEKKQVRQRVPTPRVLRALGLLIREAGGFFVIHASVPALHLPLHLRTASAHFSTDPSERAKGPATKHWQGALYKGCYLLDRVLRALGLVLREAGAFGVQHVAVPALHLTKPKPNQTKKTLGFGTLHLMQAAHSQRSLQRADPSERANWALPRSTSRVRCARGTACSVDPLAPRTLFVISLSQHGCDAACMLPNLGCPTGKIARRSSWRIEASNTRAQSSAHGQALAHRRASKFLS